MQYHYCSKRDIGETARNAYFASTNKDLIRMPHARYMFNHVFRRLQKEIQSYETTMNGNFAYLYDIVLCYAMYCYNLKSCKGDKYFQFCVKYGPLNAYVHYRYSVYLYKVIKNYKLSYYHLKLSKVLNPQMCKFVNKIQYKKMMKKLYIRLGKKHDCDNSKCNNVVNLMKGKKQTCHGCSSVYYCSKLCQKQDWITKHKHQCIRRYLKPLTNQQQQIVDNLKHFLNECS